MEKSTGNISNAKLLGEYFMNKKYTYIISGGTMVHIAPHFSLCAPAYGTIGNQIYTHLSNAYDDCETELEPYLIKTRMASDVNGFDCWPPWSDTPIKQIETNDDLDKLINYLIKQDSTRCIVMAAAVCDWKPAVLEVSKTEAHRNRFKFGKTQPRLKSSINHPVLTLESTDKIVSKIRKERKDIFLVSFKAVTDSSDKEMYSTALHSLKANSSNIVFANDLHRKANAIITPEEYPYYYSDRNNAIKALCDMIIARTKLTFTRTEVIKDNLVNPVELASDKKIPTNFVDVLSYLIKYGAYKPFRGKTAGHFGCKVWNKPYQRISSVRKRDHNKVLEEGMVPVYGERDGKIIVGGTKPSVGEHTQQRIYKELGDEVHSIVHFHCDIRPLSNDKLPDKFYRSQFGFECGSDQCAENTAAGLTKLSNGVYGCHLLGHGPNIAFHKDIDAATVIEIINKYWDLNKKSGGNVE